MDPFYFEELQHKLLSAAERQRAANAEKRAADAELSELSKLIAEAAVSGKSHAAADSLSDAADDSLCSGAHLAAQDDVRAFVGRILVDMRPTEDLLVSQRAMLCCGDKIFSPLPLDTATFGTPILISQLIQTVGTDADVVFSMLAQSRGADPQDAKILCAAGSSGTGKTHLAVAVGKRLAYVTLVRVARKGSSPVDSANFTEPWVALRDMLLVITAQCAKQRFAGDSMAASAISLCAMGLMELLLYCYVEATLLAIEAGKAAGLEYFGLLELTLRFHRNGTSDAIVCGLFMSHAAEWRDDIRVFSATSPDVTILGGINTGALSSFRADLVARVSRLPRNPSNLTLPASFLMCFDEAGTLIGELSQLFMQQAAFAQARDLHAAVDSDSRSTTMPAVVCADSGYTLHRDWFYGLACLLCEVMGRTGWFFFVTGTAFSLARFQLNRTTQSPVRGSMLRVSPSVRLGVQDMRKLLLQYWKIPVAILDSARVSAALSKCVGRPLFFIEGVFVPLFAAVKCEPKREFSVDWLAPLFDNAIGQQTIVISQLMRSLLFDKPQRLATGTGETTEAFLPRLVRAVVFKEPLEVPENMLDVAIASSLIPVAARPLYEMQTICISDEPLVQSALSTVLGDFNVETILRLVVMPTHPPSAAAAGVLAEEVLAVYLALRCGRIIASGQCATLAELLRPLFLGRQCDFPPILQSLECRAVRAVSLKTWDSTTCALRKFITFDDAIDDSVVLYDLPTAMGIDVLLLVRETHVGGVPASAAMAAPPSYRTVGFQLKDTIASTLEQVLRTLHPGTQYLSNQQRALLVNRSATGFDVSTGLISPAWDDYAAFAARFSSLAKNWIRVPTVARPIDSKLYSFAALVSEGGLPAPLVDRFYDFFGRFGLRWGASERRAAARLVAASAASSPVVFASLQSTMWLTPDDRAAFVTQSTSVMMLTKNLHVWAPVSVEAAMQAVHLARVEKAAADVEAVLAASTSRAKRGRSTFIRI